MYSSNDGIRYTNEPCPECYKTSTTTGYDVDRDCEVCNGTGRAKAE